MVRAQRAECGHLPDALSEELLDDRRFGEGTTRTLGQDETCLEEQFRRHDRQAGGACPGVTSERLRADVNGRVRRPRGALWSIFGGRVSP